MLPRALVWTLSWTVTGLISKSFATLGIPPGIHPGIPGIRTIQAAGSPSSVSPMLIECSRA